MTGRPPFEIVQPTITVCVPIAPAAPPMRFVSVVLGGTQRAVLRAVVAYIAREGIPPTIRELCADLGMSSTAHVEHHLAGLQAKGYILRRSHQARSIRVVHTPPDL